MRQTTTGSVEISGEIVASFELTRTFESRPVAVPMAGGTTGVKDLGREGQPYITFPEIRVRHFRERLHTMLQAMNGGVDARRRLRDLQANAIAVVLHNEQDGTRISASISAPAATAYVPETAMFAAHLHD